MKIIHKKDLPKPWLSIGGSDLTTNIEKLRLKLLDEKRLNNKLRWSSYEDIEYKLLVARLHGYESYEDMMTSKIMENYIQRRSTGFVNF